MLTDAEKRETAALFNRIETLLNEAPGPLAAAVVAALARYEVARREPSFLRLLLRAIADGTEDGK